MNEELKPIVEKIENQEDLTATPEQGTESAEDFREQILQESEGEVATFNQESEEQLTQTESQAEVVGLTIDSEDKTALQTLDVEAVAAQTQLVAETAGMGGISTNEDLGENPEVQRMRETMRRTDEVFNKGTDFSSEADIYGEFFRPYLSGEASFATLLQDGKSAPDTLHFLRGALWSAAHVNSAHEDIGAEKLKFFDDIKKHIASEVIDNLGNIGAQAEAQSDDVSAMRLNQNNAFYTVSETLSVVDEEKRKAAEKWLGEHVEALIKIKPFEASADGVSTEVFVDALRDILRYTEDPAIEKQYSKIALEVSSYQTIQPILERPSLSERSEEEVLFQAKQKRIATIVAGEFGLDPSIVGKWERSKRWLNKDRSEVILSREESYNENLRAAGALESESPGSSQRLFEEYGIANFARYKKEMLLRQLEIADKDVPYGVVVYPEADWNGAFFQNARQLNEASLKLQTGGIETRIVEVGSQRELARRLLALDNKYAAAGNKIKFAIIAGHGQKNLVRFGEKGSWQSPPPIPNPGEELNEAFQTELEQWKKTVLTKDKGFFSSEDIINGKGIQRASEEFFVEGAPVVLVSCSTGIEEGIAQKSSDQFGWDISGPDIPANIEKIDVTFDANGNPLFDVRYFKNDGASTRRYVAGEKVENN